MKRIYWVVMVFLLAISCQDEITVTIEKEPGSITGRILPTGIQAQVKLYQGKLKSETATDAQGYFLFEDISPGTYHLQAGASGFGTSDMYKVKVDDGEGADAGIIELNRFPFPLHNVSPYDGAENVSLNYSSQIIYLEFKRQMDPNSVENAFSISPAVENMQVNPGTPRLGSKSFHRFYVEGDFKLGQHYTFTIDTTAHTIDAEPLEFTFISSFTTEPFQIIEFAVYGRGTAQQISGDFPVYFRFNSAVDPLHFMANLTLEPAIEMVTSQMFVSDRILLEPALSWMPDTTFTFHVSSNLQEIGGVSLEHDSTFTMKVAPLAVIRTNPYHNQHFVSTSQSILIQMNNLVDEGTLSQAVAISPPVNFNIETFVNNGRSEFFLYPDSLEQETAYTVTIDTSLQDYYGGHLEEAYSFEFITE